MEKEVKRNSYKDLNAWKKSIELSVLVYSITNSFPSSELYGLTSQMRRSAISISSNMAEGMGRQTIKDTKNFLYIAKGSCYELETQIIICHQLKYIDSNQFEIINQKLVETVKLLKGLINYFIKKEKSIKENFKTTN